MYRQSPGAQSGALIINVLQCVAVFQYQCVAVRCSVSVSMCCSALQCSTEYQSPTTRGLKDCTPHTSSHVTHIDESHLHVTTVESRGS